MNVPEISVSLSGVEPSRVDDYLELCEKCVVSSIRAAGLTPAQNSELSVLLASDLVLRDLNRRWRGIDKPTNVLSFPGSDATNSQSDDPMLGDIAISIDTLEREAALENKAPNDHFCHLMIHGFLHLFGYDHERNEEAELMESLETKALSSLGIADPYAIVDQT